MRRKYIAEPEITRGPEVGCLLLLGITIGVVLSPSFTQDFIPEQMKRMQNDQRTGLLLAGESGTSERFAAELLVTFAGDDKNNCLEETGSKPMRGNQRREMKRKYIADNIKERQKLLHGYVLSDTDDTETQKFCNGQPRLDNFVNTEKLLNDLSIEEVISSNCSADQIIGRLIIIINKNRRMTKYGQNVVKNLKPNGIRMNKISLQSTRFKLAGSKLSRENEYHKKGNNVIKDVKKRDLLSNKSYLLKSSSSVIHEQKMKISTNVLLVLKTYQYSVPAI